jgi:hypothetical protein
LISAIVKANISPRSLSFATHMPNPACLARWVGCLLLRTELLTLRSLRYNIAESDKRLLAKLLVKAFWTNCDPTLFIHVWLLIELCTYCFMNSDFFIMYSPFRRFQ